MDVCVSLNHTKWERKYHVVFIPKYRRKALFGKLRPHLGKVFRELARQKESEIEEGRLLGDMCICWCGYRRSMRCGRWWGI